MCDPDTVWPIRCICKTSEHFYEYFVTYGIIFWLVKKSLKVFAGEDKASGYKTVGLILQTGEII